MLSLLDPMAVLVINAALLIVSIVLAFILLYAGTQWKLHTGFFQQQVEFRRAMLVALMFLIIIGLAALFINMFLA